MTIAIWDVCLVRSLGHESRIESIAEKYGLPIFSDTCPVQCRFTLEFDEDILKLNEPGRIRYRSLYVRSNNISRVSRRTLLGQAIDRKTKTVVDATAGLSGDSVLILKIDLPLQARHKQLKFVVAEPLNYFRICLM